jgi:hypothetical protein
VNFSLLIGAARDIAAADAQKQRKGNKTHGNGELHKREDADEPAPSGGGEYILHSYGISSVHGPAPPERA